MIELTSYTAKGWRWFWFHPEYNARAKMWQFWVRESEAKSAYNRAAFSDPRIKD